MEEGEIRLRRRLEGEKVFSPGRNRESEEWENAEQVDQ
jgi:hypothetical protein